MAQYSNLKAYIEEKIYENGTQAITGDILQDVLKVMTDDLGEFYQTGGVASPSTDPGTPDAKVIYFATEAGTYTNFGNIELAAGEVALLIFDTSWVKETLNVLSSANGGVKTANLADGAVTTAKIANGAVEEGKIADASVTSGKLGSGAVTTEKIADGAATTDKIANKAVATGKLGDKAVTTGKIADSAVGTTQVANEAITEGKIADEAVTAGKIADGAVTNGKINDGAVTEGKIGSGAVTTGKIGAKAVTTGKIADKAVTSGQLGDKAVTSDKIADGAVGSDQLAEGAFSAQNLADGSVTTDKLADDAVTAEKIADGAVTAGKFANGSVTTIKLGSGAVTTEKIGDGMVTRQKLADSSVGTSKIIDGAVTTDKVADGAITDAKLENPVSVSQNISTGYTDLTIGTETTPLPSTETTPFIREFENVELAISDEQGYPIAVFQDGEIKTQKFDSSKTKVENKSAENVDFAIADNNNNPIVIFDNGHIKTQKFDSSKSINVEDIVAVDLALVDNDGRPIVFFKEGGIATKNFDSNKIMEEISTLIANSKPKTKISYLAIGNSVNQDMVAYIPYHLKKLYGDEIDFEIGIAFIGSYTIKDYVERVITKQDKISIYSYVNNGDSWANTSNTYYLEDILAMHDWNIISFQFYQTDLEGSGRTEDVTLAPQLLSYIKAHSQQDCIYGLVCPATYTDVRELYGTWQQTVLTSCALSFLIDYGATKELLVNDGISESLLCTDGYHSNEGYPCIVISLTAIHILAKLFNLEDRASNIKYRMTSAEHSALNIPNPNGSFTTTTDENWEIGIDDAVKGGRISNASLIVANETLRQLTF